MWRFASARVTGTSHLKAGISCQDQLACTVAGTRTLVAAVADGAGSAALAERGAEVAVKSVVQILSYALDAGRSDYHAMLREAAAVAREAVLTEAQQSGSDPRDLASTLLVAVVGPNGGGALQIGDGVIVVSDGANGWCWVFWPQRGEYANTTHFLTDEDAAERLQIEPFAGKVTDVALMTDGLESLALHYASKSVHEPFFHGMFQPLLDADGAEEINRLSASLERFLSSERVRSRTDDDVSLILATCRQQDHQP
jgi:Protein phosphatase 2C